MENLVEYSWDEKTQVGEFIYEDLQTLELRSKLREQPMIQPEANQAKYFAELVWFLKTQV